ncbi:MAG: protein of unknown function, CheW-like [Nitrospira sp.]|jgi:hypothetical protein|nr:protein of unknown function, CheW-like [Nitrospira sp.]
MGLRGHKTEIVSGSQTVRFLVVLIGPTHVAFPAHWVRGIISLAEAGGEELVTWAHATYERTDLAGRFAIGGQIPTAETRVVLYGNDQRSRSFMVERVVGLVDVGRAQIQALPAQFRGGECNRLLGLFVNVTWVALIANPFWVLELPLRNNVLDAFALHAPERHAGAVESGLRLPLPPIESAAPARMSLLK